MSRDGNGSYSLPAGNPVVTGTTISSTVQNNTMNDVAAALTASLANDGQTTPTADLKMGAFKHKNVANASSRISTNANYASAADVQDGTITYLTGTAGTNTVTASAPLGLAAYVTGQRFAFVPAGANTGATTLNVNSIGAKSVFLNGAALVAGELQAVPVEVEYDGTQFNILSNSAYSSGIPGKQGADVASAGTTNLDTATGDLIDVTGVTTITAITLSQGRKRFVRFTGILILTNGASLVLPGGVSITTAAGDYAVFAGYAAGVVRCVGYFKGNALPGKQPTRQTFLTGSGTYTTPLGATRIFARAVGGGGGGSGSGGVPGSGGNGGDTTFGTLTAAKGLGAVASTGGTGGTGTNGDINLTGTTGGWTPSGTSNQFGGHGGGNPFGPGGNGGAAVSNTAGLAGATNTGTGGGGAGCAGTVSGGGGGGGGGYVEKAQTAPAATYSYGVGAAGTAGTAGGSGDVGGAGGSGIIIVDEYYA